MNTLELETRETELARKILDEDNELVINRLFSYFNPVEKSSDSFDKIPGFPYTDDEKLADIEQAMNDFYEKRTITHDEFVKQHATWW